MKKVLGIDLLHLTNLVKTLEVSTKRYMKLCDNFSNQQTYTQFVKSVYKVETTRLVMEHNLKAVSLYLATSKDVASQEYKE